MNATNTESAARRPQPRELAKILGDCRDLAIHRLLLSFSSMLDRVGDMLSERANRSDVREDSSHYLASRSALSVERGNIIAEFERGLRERVNSRIAGDDTTTKADFSKVDASKLTLVDTSAMDESVITGNITRGIENLCHDELLVLNRGMAHLLGRPDLETQSNPLSPSTIIGSFAAALRSVDVEDRIKFTILKELNQGSLGDLGAIYADINRHLVNLRVVPAANRPSLVNLDYTSNRARVRAKAHARSAAKTASAELDVMALFKQMFGAQQAGALNQSFIPQAGAASGFPGGAAFQRASAMPGAGGYQAGSDMPGGGGYQAGPNMPGGGGYQAGPNMPGGGGYQGEPGMQGGGYQGGPGMGAGGYHGSGGGYQRAAMPGAGGHPGNTGAHAHGVFGGAPGVADADGANPYWILGVEAPSQNGVAGVNPQGFAGATQHGVATQHTGAPGTAAGGVPGARADFGAFGAPSGMPDAFARHDPAAGPTFVPHAPLAPTPSGYVPGAPIISTRELGESLSRLQAGETGFDLGGGSYVRFSGIPEGKHNVLRDLQESPLAQRVNQLEAMTIELVAMLFDFIFETRDLPDGIKALLARLQIPVLKAAMLDGTFFAKKNHPSRTLVNALAQAGMGWSPLMGYEDPLYCKLHEIVHRILDDFTDNLAIFEDQRKLLEQFLEDEEKTAQRNIESTTEEINQTDRKEIAPIMAGALVERQIAGSEIPNFLASFLRIWWAATLERIYLQSGEDSEAWTEAVAMVDDLVWSVQPKRTPEERKQLVAMLPSLLNRISKGVDAEIWAADERDQFMSNLVEAHAAAVKAALTTGRLPTTAVAEQAKAEAEQAKAAGNDAAAAKAEELAVAMAPAEPVVSIPEEIKDDDHFLEIAQSLERGMWVEFEDEDGQLAFSKLAWVSPLRGTYLFCNRQGQKASSLTAEELAERFRQDRARLVEAEPLVDRAFTSMMAGFHDKLVAAS